MPSISTADRLLAEAAAHPVSGWDLSWLGDRITVQFAPWDFRAIIAEAAAQSPDLLDMGTGGGEWLSSLPVRPPRTVAAEGWAPNVPIARTRLEPLGIDVVAASGGPDNVDQAEATPEPPAAGTDGAMPFPDGSVHLICNRHESYMPAEIRRLLAPGGTFLTQQVGSDTYFAYRDILGEPTGDTGRPIWTLSLATRQLEGAGLMVAESATGVEQTTFHDIGAFAWYLRLVPWAVPGFTIGGRHDRLVALHERMVNGHTLTFPQPMFWLRARRPDGQSPDSRKATSNNTPSSARK